MSQLIETIFNDEITKQGLAALQEKYPIDLILDMTKDDVFKDARKTRTEMNKLIESIKRRRLDITGELKGYADEVTAEIIRIYNVVVLPFEKEDQVRKEKAAEAARKHQELIDSESKKIQAIYEFVADCRGKDSEHIQGIIEAVDLIETDVFHKDVIHEAIEAKKATLHDLAQLLSDTVAREKTECEREDLRKKQAEAEEKQRQAEKTQKITDRINDLRMIPAEYFNQPSKKIEHKINGLENFEITKEDFDDKVEEVIKAKVMVINQLNQMLENQKKIEAVELAEAEKLEAEEKAAEEAEQEPEEQVKQKELPKESEDVMQEDPEAIEQPKKEEVKEKPEIEDVKGFLEWVVCRTDLIDDFGYLLLSNDSKLEDEAIDNIKSNFKLYIQD